MIGNRVSAKSSTGHGSPLPGLVHGGPGRAGGGEELGGMRGVKHYMQRTAIQGAPTMLSAVTGRWLPGAEARAGGEHPFRKSLAELKIGDQLITATRTVTLDDIEHFAHFTGDTFYAHMDEEAGQGEPVLRRARGAWLSHRLFRRRPVRRSGAGSGAGQLRRRQPALPDTGQSG
jgi:oxepin-CoA hydrolase/3-oxo-5,6-dehydrosuberyl-CoA semialdehyde dehydrogenase